MACIYLGDEDGIDKRVVFEVLQHFHPLVLVSLSINERPEKNIYTHTPCELHVHANAFPWDFILERNIYSRDDHIVRYSVLHNLHVSRSALNQKTDCTV